MLKNWANPMGFQDSSLADGGGAILDGAGSRKIIVPI